MPTHRLISTLFYAVLGCLVLARGSVAQERPADLIVVNGKVLTVDDRFSIVSAAAIRDGVFVAVGRDEDIRKLSGPNTRVIDAKGKTVVPGLIETHVHSSGAARGEVEQPFVQLNSIDEIKDWVRKRAAEAKDGEWVRLPRVDVTRIRERRLPTRKDLDEAAPNYPAVFVWQYASRQIQVLNSAALKAAGITRETKAPPRGKIHFDEQGEPTGVMEECGSLTRKFLDRGPVSEEAHLASLEKLLHMYNTCGITSITERNLRFDRESRKVEAVAGYQKLKAEGRLPVRVTLTIGLGRNIQDADATIRAIPYKPGEGDDWVRIGPLKIGVDGGVLYGTAYMREPYGSGAFSLYGFSDPSYRGNLDLTPEVVKETIRAGHRLGWQMSSHVTGDAGVDMVLDAVEAANADSPIKDRRYNLIHAYFANEETAKRAARLGVCVDTQPMWYYKDGDALADAIGAKRLEKFIGVKVWHEAGVKVALNADHMQGFGPQTALNPYDPFLAMYTVISRKTETGLLIAPEQRISRDLALRMVTIDAAWISFDEKKKGSIEVGKLGDLAVLTDDFLTCDEEKIKNIRSALTVVGGKVVYEAEKNVAAGGAPQKVEPLLRAVDLNVGESAEVTLSNGKKATVKLLSLDERRDPIRNALREPKVAVEVDGQRVELVSNSYRLPSRIGTVQIDCPVTKGYNSNGTPASWGLDKDARLRLWPGDSAWFGPEAFVYPVKQRWFASQTQMCNVPTYVDGGEPARPGRVYYHSGLDVGGSEGDTEIVAATDGLVVVAGTQILDEYRTADTPAKPRYDDVWVMDGRGWFYRYSHLQKIDPQVIPGRIISKGDRVGWLGKEGDSGGWSHLHFEIKARQPSGKWGTQEGYPFIWEAYRNQYQPAVIAVARPHHLIRAGETVELDGSRSWAASGKIAGYRWKFGNGETSTEPRVKRTYDKPGIYSEILEVRDEAGNVSYDFGIVIVHEAAGSESRLATVHPAYYPTMGIKPGDPVTFKVRTFGAKEVEETWDFGDGTPAVKVHSDGNVKHQASDGYAVTTHRFEKPGNYIVSVRRSAEGYPATAHLHVVVQ